MALGGIFLRRYVGVLILGIIVVLIGLLFLAASSTPRVAATTFTLQTGASYCTHYPFDTASGGTIDVTFTSNSGPVDQYVMTQAAYLTFVGTGTANYLGFDSGVSGSFSTTLPSANSYQVVSCHGSGYESAVQSGSHTMTINALNPGPFYLGVGLLVLGGILVIVSLWLRTKPEKQPRYAVPPPYMPAGTWPGQWPGTAQPGAPPSGWPPGTVMPSAGPAPPAPAYPAAAAYGTIVMEIVNPSPAPITVQVLLNGVPTASLTVPAVGRSPVTLHPPLSVPAGTNVRVEAVTPDGRRFTQDVVANSTVAAQVTLRID